MFKLPVGFANSGKNILYPHQSLCQVTHIGLKPIQIIQISAVKCTMRTSKYTSRMCAIQREKMQWLLISCCREYHIPYCSWAEIVRVATENCSFVLHIRFFSMHLTKTDEG